MSLEEYERLVLLAARRHRGQPCDGLKDWLRADPEAAETVELLDRVGRELDAQLEATAPSAAHVASQKASLLAKIEQRRRVRRLRWAACLVATAGLVLAIILLWAAGGCRPGEESCYGRVGVVRQGSGPDAFAWGYATKPNAAYPPVPDPGALSMLVWGA